MLARVPKYLAFVRNGVEKQMRTLKYVQSSH